MTRARIAQTQQFGIPREGYQPISIKDKPYMVRKDSELFRTLPASETFLKTVNELHDEIEADPVKAATNMKFRQYVHDRLEKAYSTTTSVSAGIDRQPTGGKGDIDAMMPSMLSPFGHPMTLGALEGYRKAALDTINGQLRSEATLPRLNYEDFPEGNKGGEGYRPIPGQAKRKQDLK
jgi:hypothetical protein